MNVLFSESCLGACTYDFISVSRRRVWIQAFLEPESV